MATNLDKSLDEILSNKRSSRGGRRSLGLSTRRGGNIGSVRKTSGRSTGNALPKPSAPTTAQSDKIIISNMPYDVTADQMKEYFSSQVGAVKKVSINYNEKGQSTGIATIFFSKLGDANKAFSKFNGTPIDGGKRHMKVEIIVDPTKKSLADRIQVKAGTPSRRPNSISLRGRGSGPRRGGRKVFGQRKKSAEQLDAEMADYFGSGSNGSTSNNSSQIPAATVSAVSADIGDIPM